MVHETFQSSIVCLRRDRLNTVIKITSPRNATLPLFILCLYLLGKFHVMSWGVTMQVPIPYDHVSDCHSAGSTSNLTCRSCQLASPHFCFPFQMHHGLV